MDPESHPTGVRGLKYVKHSAAWMTWKSHPTGVRGLKFPRSSLRLTCRAVAPHWGAWIEIDRRAAGRRARSSHPTGVRGLKLLGIGEPYRRHLSHPTGVRGLKYSESRVRQRPLHVAPHWGAWIEIVRNIDIDEGTVVAPHWGAWIEINCFHCYLLGYISSHPTGVRGLKFKNTPHGGRGGERRTPLGCVD